MLLRPSSDYPPTPPLTQVNTVGTFNVIRLAAAVMAEGESLNKDGERGETIPHVVTMASTTHVTLCVTPLQV